MPLCSICRRQLRESPSQALPCGCVFHAECIQPVEALTHMCPVCQDVVMRPERFTGGFTDRFPDEPPPPGYERIFFRPTMQDMPRVHHYGTAWPDYERIRVARPEHAPKKKKKPPPR